MTDDLFDQLHVACLFSKINLRSRYSLLYVDDMVLTTSTQELHSSLMALLACELSMKDLMPLTYFLGGVVNKKTNGMFLQ